MAVTLDDVRAIALGLPEVVEGATGFHGTPGWSVRGKAFAWERPLRERDVADLQGLGERVREGVILGVRVAREEKDAVLASVAGAFHVPHFAGFPAVLVELATADAGELDELIVDAWVVQAPKRLSKPWLAERGLGE